MIMTSLTANHCLAILLCILAVGCAAPARKTLPPPQQSREAPLLPPEVIHTIELLQHNQRTLYSSRRGEYSYYISGVLNAVYQIRQGRLVITADTANKPRVCTYNDQGVLQQSSKAPDGKDKGGGAICNTLIRTLAHSLSAVP